MELRLATLITLGLVVGAGPSATAQERGDARDAPERARVQVIGLAPGVLRDPSRVPTFAAQEIGDALPSELAWGDHPVRRRAGRLEIATRDQSRFDVTLRPGEWRLLRMGSARWPRDVLVFHRDGAWRAASAAALTGSTKSSGVELVDVDGDGAFGGDDDLVRTGDGAFRRRADAPQLWIDGRLGAHQIVREGDAHELRFVPQPAPDWALPAEAAGWRAVNAWRNRFGLGPQQLDRERVIACRRHQAYWDANGYSGHAEERGRPGYSDDGAKAGRRSSVWGHRGVARLANNIAREILHRHSLIAYDREGLGLTEGRAGSLIWGGRLTPRTPRAPLLVPGRGQRLVPTTIDRELPDPQDIPGFYGSFHGYPVAVYYPRSTEAVKDARLTVTKFGSRDPLPGALFTEERPYHPRYSDREIVFVARDPLAHGAWYRARFEARVAAGPIDISWTFTTGNEPFPGGGD